VVFVITASERGVVEVHCMSLSVQVMIDRGRRGADHDTASSLSSCSRASASGESAGQEIHR
jgi:hypothetical protein